MSDPRPFIVVLAGVNGAGKSSVIGTLLAAHGLSYFNPDTMARHMVAQTGLAPDAANMRAGRQGLTNLRQAIADETSYAFETTLSGSAIPALLLAAAATHRIVMLYCGLETVELHLRRVAQRVAFGGHDIPEAKIRERWITSRANLIRILPVISRLQLFDNSVTVGTGDDIPPARLILETREREIFVPVAGDLAALASIPDWAKPIFQAARDLARGAGGAEKA
ncbi:AAA family ATPase [Nitrospirillum sp. BR 11752]|uniref:AAA family ATPase n=1 Tax=Nitrospirillum sp. BR 11752 TaxID=3104293 RepID=UPI002E99FFE8|nr:AAA family ATPase [Nitrospirillum sp. BR 11752]